MKKKLLIIGAIVVAVLAVVPVVGNVSVTKVVDNRIKMLDENGIKVEKHDNGSTYTQTKTHYEFILEDPEALQKYIDSLSEAQVPAYVSAMLDDVVMGADVSYSNMLVASSVTIELYPVAFTQEASERMKAEDAGLYTQMVQMLDEKTFLYHMDYDVAGSTFKGYIKDIDKTITFQDGKNAKILFTSATFTGKGTLVKPESVLFNVKNADVDFALPEGAKMMLKLSDLKSSSDFSAKYSFNLDYKLSSFDFFFKDPAGELQVDATDIEMRSASIVTDKKMDSSAFASVKTFKMHDLNGSMEVDGLFVEADLKGIDEAAYLAFQKASNQAGPSSQYTALAALGIVSKGFSLDVKRLSTENITIKDSEKMAGFSHKLHLTVKPDAALIQTIQISPMAAANNIALDANLKFSKTLYTYIQTHTPNMKMLDMYAEVVGDDVLFNLTLQDAQLMINGKKL